MPTANDIVNTVLKVVEKRLNENPKMATEEIEPFYREQLQAMKANEYAKAVRWCLECIHSRIIEAAKKGHTKFDFSINMFNEMLRLPHMVHNGGMFILHVKFEELAEGLVQKYPDSKVTLLNDWVDVRPGVREQRYIIIVDWS